MSYAIIRNANHKMNSVPLLERHNERRNKNYSNKDIDLSRSSENFHLKKIEASTYQQEFERIRQKHNLKGNLRLTGEKQSNVMCEFVITSDKEFFERLGTERTKRFFADAYKFVTAKVGANFVVSAVVHMDEATPHMHVTYIPVINGKDRKGNPCKRINCSEFWKGRDSYSRLQDEYYDYVTARGYDLERGVKGSTAEHLSVAEFKLKKTEDQLAEIAAQISEVERVDEIKSANLPLNKVAINKSDYENLISTAKHYVSARKAEEENISLRAECQSLRNKNEELRNENDRISNQLHTLEYKFDEFYSSVEDEVALRDENAKLKSEKLAAEYAVDYERHCKGYTALNENMRFSEMADWYFENYAPIELKESTAYTYRGQYNKHIAPILGNVKVKDITTPKLTHIMQSYKLNPATVRKIYIVVQSIFHRGVEQGFIRESPCRNVILPKNKNKNKKPVLDEQQTKDFLTLLDTKPCDEDIKRIIKVLLFTGMRCGECLALSWNDIDYEEKTISIKHNLVYANGRHFLTTPKTESSIRTIGISDALADIFKIQQKYVTDMSKALGSSYAHPEMVFPSGRGNYRDRSGLNTSFRRFLKGTSFEFLTLHQLRHCNATLLLNSGVDLKIVSEHLGHCDIGVTANIYADVLKSTKAKVADLVALKLS